MRTSRRHPLCFRPVRQLVSWPWTLSPRLPRLIHLRPKGKDAIRRRSYRPFDQEARTLELGAGTLPATGTLEDTMPAMPAMPTTDRPQDRTRARLGMLTTVGLALTTIVVMSGPASADRGRRGDDERGTETSAPVSSSPASIPVSSAPSSTARVSTAKPTAPASSTPATADDRERRRGSDNSTVTTSGRVTPVRGDDASDDPSDNDEDGPTSTTSTIARSASTTTSTPDTKSPTTTKVDDGRGQRRRRGHR